MFKLLFFFKEAEISIKFYRGIATKAADDDLSSSTEQVKTEFESIKSLISERAGGTEKIEFADFRKNNRNPI